MSSGEAAYVERRLVRGKPADRKLCILTLTYQRFRTVVIISNNGEKGCPIAIQRDFELTVAEPSTEVYTPTVTIPSGKTFHSYGDLRLLIHISNHTCGNQHISHHDDGQANTHVDCYKSKVHPQAHYDNHAKACDHYKDKNNWYHPENSLYCDPCCQDQDHHQNLQSAAQSYSKRQEGHSHSDPGHCGCSTNHDYSRPYA